MLLLPKQQGRALFLQDFFLPGCTLSMDKVASLFYPVCCLHSALGRQLELLTSQSAGWRKKPRMWLLWAVQGKRSGSVISSDWLEDVQAKRVLLTSLWVPCQSKGAAGFGFVQQIYLSRSSFGIPYADPLLPLPCRESLPWRMHKEDKKGSLRALLYQAFVPPVE